MNQVYRVIWNATAGTWTAAAETAKGRTKSKSSKAAKALALVLATAATAAVVMPHQALAYVAGTGATQGNGNNTVIGDNASGPTAACISGSGIPVACSTVIGNGANTTFQSSTIIGDHASTTGGFSVAIGSWATAGSYSQAIGANAQASSDHATAIGQSALATMTDSSAVGTNAKATGLRAVAIGSGAKASANDAFAIGSGTNASGTGSMAFGTNVVANGTNAIGLGLSSNATGNGAMALGAASAAGNTNTTALGTSANASGVYSTALGSGAIALAGTSNGGQSTAVGYRAQASESNATALGTLANASGTSSVALGKSTIATGASSVAMGDSASASASKSVAIGFNANVTAANAVALGAGSVATVTNTVSVGAVGAERTIVNVKAGINDTDAVNVSQLKGITTALGGGAAVNADGTINAPSYTVQGTTYNNVGAALGGVNTALNTTNTNVTNVAGNLTTLTNNINNGTIGLVQQTAAGADLTVGKDTGGVNVSFADSTGKTRTLTNVTAGVNPTDAVNMSQLTATNTQVTQNTLNIAQNTTDITNLNNATRFFKADGLIADADAIVTAGSNSVAIGANSVAAEANTVSVGAVGSERKIVNVAAGVNGTDAVNVSQLSAVTGDVGQLANQAVKYDTNLDGSINYGSVTLAGDPATGTQLKNVANGVDSHDAVNVSQLDTAKTDLGTQITNVSNSLSTQIGDVSTNLTAATRFFKADGLIADADATVTAGSNSVAIGANSVAAEANTVSVGAVGSERKIVNVAAGVNGTDAVNVSQLSAVTGDVGQLANQAVKYDTNLDGSINYNSVTMGNGNSTGPVAIHNVAAGIDDTDAVNVKQLTDSLAKSGLVDGGGNVLDAVTYDPGFNRGQVTLGGVGATTHVVLTNVADGKNQYDAVNFGQLSQLQGQVTTIGDRLTVVENTSNNAAPISAPIAALDPHVATSGDPSNIATASNNNSVALGAGSVTTQDDSVSVGSAGNERAITNVHAGVNDTDASNVGQMNAAISSSAMQTLQSANNYTDQRFAQVEHDIDNVDKAARQGIAAAAALSNVTPYLPGKTALNAGVAGYRGQVALGITASRWNQRGNFNLNAGVSSAGGNSTIVRAGIGMVLGN